MISRRSWILLVSAFAALLSGAILFSLRPTILFGGPATHTTGANINSEIAEAVFRYQIARSVKLLHSDYFCIEYTDETPKEPKTLDPPVSLQSHLSSAGRPVYVYSKCPATHEGDGREGYPKHLSWIKLTSWFVVHSVTCHSDTRCEADGVAHAHSLHGRGETYYLEKRDGTWNVVKTDLHWIS